jgi:hypothetical protein
MSTFGYRNYQNKSLTHFSIKSIESLSRALLEAIFLNFSGQYLKSNNIWIQN